MMHPFIAGTSVVRMPSGCSVPPQTPADMSAVVSRIQTL